MDAPVRVLHVVSTMDYGGVETLLMEIYRNIDRTKVQFDFLCHNTSEGKYCEEIKRLGGRIFSIKSILRSYGSIRYKKKLYGFFRNHPEYKIVHSHINGGNGYVLQVAKKSLVPVRISHSHVANRELNPLRDFYFIKSMRCINSNATEYFACSRDAARFLYIDADIVDKTVILNNAIDTQKFKFNLQSRKSIQKMLNLEDKYTFIHVGRFMEEKNHRFLIDVFAEIDKRLRNCALLLLGAGPLLPEIQSKVNSLGLSDKVVFVGSKPNVNDYLSASDAFLFPSLFEGLGIVAVEAQCSGLPTFASDNVPPEAKRTELLNFLSLADSADKWAEKIIPVVSKTHDEEFLKNRVKYADVVKDSGYDIRDKAGWLEDFYIGKYSGMNKCSLEGNSGTS